MTHSTVGKREPGVKFIIPFEGKPNSEVEVVAYAFDHKGVLIDSAAVKNGEVVLNLPARQARHTRLMFAPSIRRQLITPEVVRNMSAYEPVWEYDPKVNRYELLPIPEFHWQWWFWCQCRVRGRVVRPVEFNGVLVDMPVCGARVHICEVDRLIFIWPLLPDDIIWRIRDELLVAVQRPFPPIPEPDPEPFFRFDPSVLDISPENIALMNLGNIRAFDPQPEPPMPMATRLASTAERTMQPIVTHQATLAELPLETLTALTSESITVVRDVLLDNLVLIRPYLCLWPWLWPFLTCQEVAVVETDHQGRFDTTIWYLCFGDHPDLYFWVEYPIGGNWETVYHPPMRCYTYWNYECGSHVTIRVTDPRVPWCDVPPSMPGLQVAVMTLGNNVSVSHIQDEMAGADEGLTGDGRPFGGSVEPHVWFGEDLITNGITHYRWSYSLLGANDWHALDSEVVRHYGTGNPVTFVPYLLGPDLAFSDNRFKIQPEDPPSGSWAPMINGRLNTASAFFLTHLLAGGNAGTAAGKYELKLEIFRNNGTLVENVAFRVPDPDEVAPFGAEQIDTIPAPETNLIRNGTGDVVAFRLVVHVDNNPCQAEIYPVTVDGNTAGPCGFIGYANAATSEVNISFKAFHPNNFATFGFAISRGSQGVVESASGGVGDSPVNGYVRDVNSVFAKEVGVDDLLGDCIKAAFAETMHVYALATDGWGILNYLDAGAVPLAFALEPAS